MTLRTRLSLGIAAVALVLVLPQLFAIRALRRVDASMVSLQQREFGASLLVGRVRAKTEELSQLEVAMVSVPESAAPRAQLVAALDTLGRLVDSLRPLGLAAEAASARSYVGALVRSTTREWELARAGR